MSHGPDYDRYINSSTWANRRKRFYSKYGKQCWRCSITTQQMIHLHHHTYLRFKKELDEDLVPLCEPCHGIVHAFYDEHRGLMNLTEATKTMVSAHPNNLGREIVLVPRASARKKVLRIKTPKTSRPSKPHRRRISPKTAVRQHSVALVWVSEKLGVSKNQLHYQGFKKRIPLTTLGSWIETPPSWASADVRTALGSLRADLEVLRVESA